MSKRGYTICYNDGEDHQPRTPEFQEALVNLYLYRWGAISKPKKSRPPMCLIIWRRVLTIMYKLLFS